MNGKEYMIYLFKSVMLRLVKQLNQALRWKK